MKNYLIIIEKSENGYGAYAPDIEGCGAVGRTQEEAKHNLIEALKMHIDGLKEDNLPIPEPSALYDYAKLA